MEIPESLEAKNRERFSPLISPLLLTSPFLWQHPDVVAVAASAAGLQAISTILSALPSDFPAAIVIVQHLAPDRKSLMAPLLSRHTSLRVKEAEEGDELRVGWVYIAPGGKHLLVNADRRLSLSLAAKVHFNRPSADVLLMSVAAIAGNRAIGIVLTGGGSDGSAGIQAIKRAGGVTMAQDRASSEHFSMPGNAIATGAVDFILPLLEIAPALVTLMTPA